MLAFLLGCAQLADPVLASGELASDEGLYDIAHTHLPDPPEVGEAQVLLEVSADGPLDDLALELEPWMPAHDHGLSDPVDLVDLGDGRWEASFAYTMSGTWELRVSLSSALGDDIATIPVEVY